ncbi:MAG: 50S ribosomal protein L22 [Chloroflexi bacterium]|nr:50S ribosomal protein L22 [Chloroflexota bacterium]
MAIESQAVAKYIRLSPSKARRVMALLRGRGVPEALDILKFLPHAAAGPIARAIRSAAANAEDAHGLSVEDLVVARLSADDGPRLKRFRAGARGRAKPILRRTAHLTVVVREREK